MDRVDELLAAYAPWAAREQSWPLTLFERFMLGDDRPHYPLVFQADLCFEGGVDPAAMQQAFRFASGRHPLLRSTIRGEGRAAEWVTAARGWPELAIFDGTAAGEPSLQAIDLNRSPGLRGWMRKTAVGWDVKLLFHHACCDGQGARMFIQDLVLAYALLRDVSKSPTPFFPLDVTELDRRGRYPAPLGRARLCQLHTIQRCLIRKTQTWAMGTGWGSVRIRFLPRSRPSFRPPRGARLQVSTTSQWRFSFLFSGPGSEAMAVIRNRGCGFRFRAI